MNRFPLYPPPLKKGDTLSIIAPAGQLKDLEAFSKGICILKEMGFSVKFPKDLWPGQDYLADSDKNRADELNKMFGDPEINGLIMMRGGYGCLRMMDRIDLKQIIRNPKIIVGFSDISILQNYLYEKIGMVSLHGPVVTSLHKCSNGALESFYHCLTGAWHSPVKPPKIEILRQGPTSSGPLVGGNLASMVTLLGTSYDFNWEGKIVLLEDIDEPPYRIDRMLTQLFLAGKMQNISGLILGDFSISSYIDEIEKLRYSEQIWTRVLELSAHSAYPVWANFPFGHCPENTAFPLGASATMEKSKTRLVFT
ncbi:MAG: LD-carboxypeptidase [Deltaproteobacteria bacterium]|nr:LD-carboxypeptidase [Deltaproteobacteria bacterium]MBW2660001.1 LD-carboxypeptidase [Deltaproteobacteria bacterium]